MTIFPTEQNVEICNRFNARITACGSRITCNPPPADTDEDWLVLLDNEDGSQDLSNLVEYLNSDGWNWEGEEHYQSVAENDFMSFRKGAVNLIVTKNAEFACRHEAATHVCKRLNLMDKADRVMVFQAVLYGVSHFGGANG